MSEKMVNEKENAVDTAVEGTTNDKEPKEEVKAGGKKTGDTAVTEKVKKESKKKEGELTAESTESEKNLDKDKKAGTEKIQDSIKIRTYSGEVHIKNASDESAIKKYEQYMNSKEIMDVQFSALQGKIGFVGYDGKIKIIMSTKNVDGFSHSPIYNEALEKYLFSPCPVVVTKVDKKKKEVHVSMVNALSGPRENLISEIEKGLKEREYIRVPAVVVSVSGRTKDTKQKDYSIAVINIGGLGILGYVHKNNWSKSYTKSLLYAAEPGMVIDVVVTEKKIWGRDTAYECSRRDTIDFDPWAGIEQKMRKNMTVRVRCNGREDGRYYGSIEGLPEINVFCYYPEEETGIHVEEGKYYIGVVRKVSEEDHDLRVRTVDEVPESKHVQKEQQVNE